MTCDYRHAVPYDTIRGWTIGGSPIPFNPSQGTNKRTISDPVPDLPVNWEVVLNRGTCHIIHNSDMTAAYGDGWQWMVCVKVISLNTWAFSLVAEFSIRRAHSYDTPVQFSALSKTACGNILKPPPRSM